MDRINGAGHVAHKFVAENVLLSQQPTEITAEWLNGVQEEIVAPIVESGQALDGNDNTLLLKAIKIIGRRMLGAQGVAGGTVNAITATFDPIVSALVDGMTLAVHAAGANTSTTPTFSPGVGVAAKTIIKGLGVPLLAGDIEGAGYWMHLRYDGTAEKWILLNPVSQPGLQAGEIAMFARSTAPTGYLKANGAAISRTTYSALFAAIGTTFGAGDGATTFNVPDLRGEFVRGWDDSRGADSGRLLGSAQADASQGHNHRVYSTIATSGSSYQWNGSTSNFVDGTNPTALIARDPISDGVNGTPRIAAETRPRNVALLACIKY